ncbi:hypothetical protein AB4Z22_01250 [Paenibacillus sp. TAF58]
MDKTIPGEKFDLGVCYYPKHWLEQMWPDDYKRLRVIEIHLLLVESFRQEHISLDTRAQRGFIILRGSIKSFV